MNRQEIIELGRKVAAICPAQRFNAETPDAWEALLGWVEFEDALSALFVLGQTEKFIAPSDIIRQVRLARRDRLRTHVVPAPADPDDAAGYRAQVRQSTRAAAAPPVPGRLALTAGLDDVTARRAAQLRASGGGRLVDPVAAPKHSPAPVRDALAEARRRCEEGARRWRGDDPPRKRWRPPVDPTPQRGDVAPLSGRVLRDAVDNPPPPGPLR